MRFWKLMSSSMARTWAALSRSGGRRTVVRVRGAWSGLRLGLGGTFDSRRCWQGDLVDER